jgi:hypothetical protein
LTCSNPTEIHCVQNKKDKERKKEEKEGKKREMMKISIV